MSRTAGGEMVFDEVEKEAFRRLMWRMARFSGVDVLAYALMGNHVHCRVRWFSDGAATGSKAFVEGVFTACREHFGAKRKMGARKVGQDSAGTLHSLRKLRVNPVG